MSDLRDNNPPHARRVRRDGGEDDSLFPQHTPSRAGMTGVLALSVINCALGLATLTSSTNPTVLQSIFGGMLVLSSVLVVLEIGDYLAECRDRDRGSEQEDEYD